MKTSFFLFLALILGGCASTKPVKQMPTVPLARLDNNSPYVSRAKIMALVVVAKRHLDLDTDRIAITIDNFSDEFYCQGHDACTHKIDAGQYDYHPFAHIFVPWRPDKGEEVAAELVAHELCHAYMIQNTGDGDTFHTHHNYFARTNGEYGGSKDYAGLATTIAKEYVQEFGGED